MTNNSPARFTRPTPSASCEHPSIRNFRRYRTIWVALNQQARGLFLVGAAGNGRRRRVVGSLTTNRNRGAMNDFDALDAAQALALPLLPLSTGVVLPQMVVTLALESDEAREAAAGADEGDGRLLLVPKIGPNYAKVGTVARIENRAELAGGQSALVLRGVTRAIVGPVVPSEHPGLWVSVELVVDGTSASGRVQELIREYRAVVRGIAEQLGSPRLRRRVARRRRPWCPCRHRGLVARSVGGAQGGAARDARHRGAAREGTRLGTRHARGVRTGRQDPYPGVRGRRQEPA